MGEFRFRVPVDWKLDPYHANSIHVVGLDGIPWPCRISVTDDPSEPTSHKLLQVSRNRDESGRLYLIYPFPDRGEMLICTGTLPVREQTYELLTEVARGTLNRLRNQLSIWEEGGLEIRNSILQRVQEATEHLGRAIMGSESEVCDTAARKSIECSMHGIFDLADTFGTQIAQFRLNHDQLAEFWVAATVNSLSQFEACATTTEFDLIEFCLGDELNPEVIEGISESALANSKRLIAGPWLDASVGGMSRRLIDVDDFLARKDQLLIDCRQQLADLPSATSLIHVVSGLNGIGHRHLSYPQQLQVTVDMLRAVEESGVELPTLVSFDFPWAERLVGAVGGVHPLQIADSLLRQGLPISYLGLDINLDYWPNGCAVRDPLQWVDLIDVWSQLGLPIVICLRVPLGDAAPPSSDPELETVLHQPSNQPRSDLNDEQRCDFLKTILPVLIARPSVHGLVWRQWQDQDDPRFPRAGFVGNQGEAKETCEIMRVAEELSRLAKEQSN